MLPPNLRHFLNRNLRCQCALLIKLFFPNGVFRDAVRKLYQGISLFLFYMYLSIECIFMKKKTMKPRNGVFT
jgi:hypothetical protein